MMNKITIQTFRHIKRLEFEIPWKHSAVYLLTGANGAGKSTLLACLDRIGNPNAFQTFFKQNIVFREEPAADIFSEAEIAYTAGNSVLRFHCRDHHWTSGNSNEQEREFFSGFGFPHVYFAGRRGKDERICSETFSLADVRSAEPDLKDAIRDIFDDDKFDTLQSVGRDDRELYLVQETIRGQRYYFSENNFSSGERCVLQLLRTIRRVPNRSLILIDESEMALHPKAQRRLLTYLEKAAAAKELTVIVSTHSATLIKTTDPRRLLFLEHDDQTDSLICRNNVYPAAILGEMAVAEEILPDTILLVEDPEAAMLLEAIINKLKCVTDLEFPYYKLLPVGGYMQVVILLDNLSKVFPPFVKRRAVLDRDAAEPIGKILREPNRSHFEVVHRNRDRIYFLPCTPEQGVIRLLESDPKTHSRGLSEALETPPLNLPDVIRGSRNYSTITGSTRSECKEKLSLIVEYIGKLTGEPEYNIRRKLYRYYIDKNYRNISDLKEDYCSLIFKR